MISPNFNMSTSIRYALAAIPQISVIEYPDYLELIEAIMDSDLVITSNDQIACEVRALERGYICLDHDLAELIKKAQLPETALQSSDHGLDSFNTSLQDLKLILSYDNPERLPRVQTNYGDGKAGFRIAKLIDNWARNHVFTPHAYDPWH
jgi:UDP-N-acetylglucosamine 2-epimerase